jgi:hypothetical protein
MTRLKGKGRARVSAGKVRFNRVVVFLAALSILAMLHPAGGWFTAGPGAERAFAADDVDVQWFKQTMKIGEQYQERQEGVLGMSWAHFIFMTFLVLFFIGVLVAAYVRNKRTKELLNALLKEEANGAKG